MHYQQHTGPTVITFDPKKNGLEHEDTMNNHSLAHSKMPNRMGTLLKRHSPLKPNATTTNKMFSTINAPSSTQILNDDENKLTLFEKEKLK
jgi:hypothetical protein